ncbi:MAG: TlpA disulfide reductase family protein [Clostridiales bacterium]
MKKYIGLIVSILVLVLFIGGSYIIYNSRGDNSTTINNEENEGKESNESGETAEDSGGELAEDFNLMSNDNKMYKLSDFRGKIVVLNFWATWCGPCKSEIPDFQKAHEKFEKDGDVVILAINLTDGARETKSDVIDFVESNNLTMKVLFDEKTEVATKYGINNIPTTYVLNKEGKIYKKKTGMITYDELISIVSEL